MPNAVGTEKRSWGIGKMQGDVEVVGEGHTLYFNE